MLNAFFALINSFWAIFVSKLFTEQFVQRKTMTMPIILNILFALQSISMTVNLAPQNKPITLFNFSKGESIKNWRIVNDDVMGGISTATFNLSKEGNGIFQGKVSTKNNGGFASVRYIMDEMNIKESTRIKIKVKGDGKNYQFRIKNKTSDYFSYITTFSTNGEWQVIELKLKDFYASFRGRKLEIPNFDKSAIGQAAILIANGKDEAFKLEIDIIEVY